MDKLTLDEIIECHSLRQNVDRELLMDYLIDDQPELLEFMYLLKDRFGGCSMPKFSRTKKEEVFTPAITEEGYCQGFISYASAEVDEHYDSNRGSQNINTVHLKPEDYHNYGIQS